MEEGHTELLPSVLWRPFSPVTEMGSVGSQAFKLRPGVTYLFSNSQVLNADSMMLC